MLNDHDGGQIVDQCSEAFGPKSKYKIADVAVYKLEAVRVKDQRRLVLLLGPVVFSVHDPI